MRLPGLELRFVDPAKIARYLLDPNHPNGGSKARFFMRFGFDPASPEVLGDALFDHGAAYEVARATELPAVWSYLVEGPLRTPDERNPWVRSVWVSEPDGHPYLVTAYPVRRRG